MIIDNLDLLIIEKGNTLDISQNNNYSFEGPFTSFGVKNKNRRVYEAKDFIPHLKELQEQIKEKKLLGELDHPKDFEIMLSRASHVIEDLQLDESGNNVIGKIKLLDTEKGRDAKAIADAGVPLHISSRAAGSVNESGVVTVKKLFTYDLVADPGFANAKLEKISENYNITEEKAAELQSMITESQSFNTDELVLINEKLNIGEDEGIEVYQIVKKAEESIKENKDDKLSDKATDKVTVEQLTNWSNVFIKEVKTLIDNKVSENKGTNENTELDSYVKTLSDEVNQKFSEFHEFANYLSQGMNQLKDFTNYISEGMNQLKEHNDSIVTGAQALKEHNDYIIENMSNLKLYSEKAHEEISFIKEHNNHISDNSNKLAEFVDHVAEKTNQGINYTETLSNNTKLLKEFVNHIAENVSVISKNGKTVLEPKKEETKPEPQKSEEPIVSESTNVENYKSDITSKIDALLEKAKKEKEESINTLNKDERFLQLLPENYQSEFKTLPEDKKQKLKEVYESKDLSNDEAVKLYDETVSEDKSLNWLDMMPKELETKWEKLSESAKEKVKTQAQGYSLDTEDRIKWFWESRNFDEIDRKPISLPKVNESTDDSLGYVIDTKAFVEQMKKFRD